MDEARRFLRFVIPGALYGLVTALLLSLLRPDWIGPALLVLRRSEGLLPVAGGLAASGVLGFLFGMIHHEIQSTFGGTIDHSAFVRDLIRNDFQIRVVTDEGVRQLAITEATPEAALAIVTAEWHQRADSPPIRGVTTRVDSLLDLAHSSGAALIASIFSLVTAFVIAAFNSHCSREAWDIARFLIACVIGLSLVWLFRRTNRRVTNVTQAVIQEILLRALWNQQGDQPGIQRPVVRISTSGLLPDTRLQPAAALRRLLQRVRRPARRG